MSDHGEEVKVYLRFRPMDKLETSKRSKDCIELHTNPQIVTVDSPLQGVYDFTFDMVGRHNFSCKSRLFLSLQSSHAFVKFINIGL